MTAAVTFDGVQRWFGPHLVLKGLSLRIEPGQVYALLGRNGSGKTTALRILLGLLAPHVGAASVFGVDSQRLGPAERARIAYVGEEHRLYATMTVGGAIAFEAGTRPKFRRDVAERAVQRCGLRLGQRIPFLSRGQRATLCLILAVAGQSELLVCDDPALGLDVVMRREFLDVLIDLLADTGCTVLFSSHFLADVERIADRVGLLHDGALLVDATMDDIKRRVVRCAFTPNEPGVAPDMPQLLRQQPRQSGCDLLLLDPTPETYVDLRAQGQLVVQGPPSLEDLFALLVGPERAGLLGGGVKELLAGGAP